MWCYCTFQPDDAKRYKFANKGGKVLGVCNGFQILCESGLLPGVLLRNAQQQFVCKNVFIHHTRDADQEVLKIPVAHGEGRYFANQETMEAIEKNNQVLFRYCDENGEIDASHNPNGAIDNIAGICNEQENVIGMMPHPERACNTALNNTDGMIVFNKLFGIN